MRLLAGITLFCALLFAVATVESSAEESSAEETGLLLIDGRPVGYYHQQSIAVAGGLTRSEITQRLAIARLGTRFDITRRETWLEGDSLIHLEAVVDLNGQAQRVEARAVPGGIETVQENAGQVHRAFLPVEGKVAGAHLASQMLQEALRLGRDRLEYQVFLAEGARVDRVEMLLTGEGERVDSLGRTHRGLLAEERMSSYPGLSTLAVVDSAGRLLYARTEMGLSVEMVGLDLGPEEAERLLAAGQEGAGLLDVGMLGVPVRGLKPLAGKVAHLESALFRFTGEGLEVLEEKLRDQGLPAQRRGESLEVRLKAPGAPDRIPRQAVAELPLDPDDPRLDELLEGAVAGEELDTGVLRRRVYRTIARKSTRFGFAGIREILDAREGDCTEHALLLAVLLRRGGVPARLACGFVLTDRGFLGHAWTEAWHDGNWRALDPSFPEAESRRLKIRLFALDPDRPIDAQMDVSLLQIGGGVRGEILQWTFADGR